MVFKAGRVNTVTRLFKQRDSKLRSRLSVFLICLFISFSIWTIIRLNREYDYQVFRKASYLNAPKNRILSAFSDTSITLKLKVKGMRLLSMQYVENKRPINIDLSLVRFLKKEYRHYNAYLTSSDLLPQLSAEMNYEGRLDNVFPDTLYFRFEKIKRKKVPVRLNTRLTFDKQFMLYDSLRLNPDSVFVSGPVRVIDTLRFVHHKMVELKNLKEGISVSVPVEIASSPIAFGFEPEKVLLSIEVEKFTEATVEVPVESFPTGECRMKAFPEKVKVLVQVPLRDFKSLDASQFIVVADCSIASQQSGGRIPVRVLRHPALTRVVLIEPSTIEFLLQ